VLSSMIHILPDETKHQHATYIRYARLHPVFEMSVKKKSAVPFAFKSYRSIWHWPHYLLALSSTHANDTRGNKFLDLLADRGVLEMVL